MLRAGPIPFFVHGLIEYVAAVAFLLAPFVLAFESDAATWLSVGTGVVLLVLAATTDGPTSLVDQMPIAVHVLLDYVLALALVAAPFVLGFSDEGSATAWFIALGVVHLLVSIGTRYLPERHPSGVGPLARTTSTDVESGGSTVIDDESGS